MHLRYSDVLEIDRRKQTLTTLTLLIAIVTSTLVPMPALAFEAQLPTATTAAFQATVTVVGRDLPVSNDWVARSRHSYVSAGGVLSYASPVTIVGNWPMKRTLALAIIPTRYPAEPQKTIPLVLEGEASYYSRAGCLGCNAGRIMANGQPLNDSALTMAIGADKKHLVGRRANVTSLATGLSTEVTITDTGSFYRGQYGNRVADLTIATKQAIGMKGGVGQVRVEIY